MFTCPWAVYVYRNNLAKNSSAVDSQADTDTNIQ